MREAVVTRIVSGQVHIVLLSGWESPEMLKNSPLIQQGHFHFFSSYHEHLLLTEKCILRLMKQISYWSLSEVGYLPPSGCEPYREAIDGSACCLSGSHSHIGVPIRNKKKMLFNWKDKFTHFQILWQAQMRPKKKKPNPTTTKKPGYVKTGFFSNWHRIDHILLNKILNYPGWGREENI